jgi:hypothetical protein
MKRMTSAIALLLLCAPAWPAPPPGLQAALAAWAAPVEVSRFQFVRVDLNRDDFPDVVVYVSDPAFCGNGGCPLLVFKGMTTGYEKVGFSGNVGKPIYLLKEANSGWRSLAAMVGFGTYLELRPIRFLGPQYNPSPIMRGGIELTSSSYERVLNFEEYP